MSVGSVELRVRSVRIDGEEPRVLLEDRATGLGLEIPVGPFEASAVILHLEGIIPPRPLTHDLLAQLFEESGFSLERVELFGEGGERARLSYRKDDSRREKEVRPSDALALALRLGAPITADASLLEGGTGSSPLYWRRRARALDQRRRGDRPKRVALAPRGGQGRYRLP